MATNTSGSTWKKWDLHVHTPESFVHNYPGEKEEAWEAFLTDLESLPEEFKVIGINDYVLVDGYERILTAKQKGRISNIDLILPVVELRIDKFGGVVKGGKDGYSQSGWSRVNLHVIFDQVSPEFIRQQFLSAIAPRYNLIPGSNAGVWGGVINRETIEALGNTIIESVPAERRTEFGAPLIEGFNNLNISSSELRDALQNPQLQGKFLTAIGKTEWENLKWDDHTIADKKTLINDAHLVFTASENPESYLKGRNKLVENKINSNLLDCSDAHSLSSSDEKDRIGNCFTWIKANATFQGLMQAIEEFEHRVYVGDNPPKRQLVEQHKTKFIKSITVKKKDESSLPETWFNLEIPLNPDLIAIIGNKGSGKSALSDIIALIGNTKNYNSFSFLTSSRFRNQRTKFAQHFEGTLRWHDNADTFGELHINPDLNSVERIKYLPQSYLEGLCNELGEGGSVTFDAELRKIIYSHVPDEDRLGLSSMDELLNFKVSEINQAKQSLRKKIVRINAEIIETDRRMTPDFKAGLEQQLLVKNNELNALEGAKPHVIEDPNASESAQAESKEAAEKIDKLETQIIEIDNEIDDLKSKKSIALKNQAVAKRIVQALTNYQNQYQFFADELNVLLSELETPISVESLVDLKIKSDPINSISKLAEVSIHDIDTKIQNSDPGSLSKRKVELIALISEAKSALGERERQFIRYKDELAKWEKAMLDIIGDHDKHGSIKWIEREIQSLLLLPDNLKELRAKRIHLSKEIYGQIQAMTNEYQRLYEPVRSFVKSAEQMDMKLPLDFQVQIEESGFQDQFLNRLNRQVRGSFAGVDESSQMLRNILQESAFTTDDNTAAFVEKIDDMLRYDRRENIAREVRLSDQVRKGTEPHEILDYVFGLDFLSPRYSLTFDGQEIGQLSPGERGLLLLVFYLLVDKEDIPIVIDQPEENLDNQTIFKILVKCIKEAKKRRQVIMVTHNPNLAVVCDAEQIIYAFCDKSAKKFDYESGAIEDPHIKDRVVEILEGTAPAFKNRQSKYKLS